MKVRICIHPDIVIDEIELPDMTSGDTITNVGWERAEEWLSDHWYMEIPVEAEVE